MTSLKNAVEKTAVLLKTKRGTNVVWVKKAAILKRVKQEVNFVLLGLQGIHVPRH